MAAVDAFVWHDQNGTITAIGRVTAHAVRKVEPLVHGDRRVLLLSVDEQNLRTLHVTHRIDIDKGLLVPGGQPSST